MRAGHQKDQAMIRNLELSVPTSSSGRGRGLETEISRAHVIKPPLKMLILRSLESFQVGEDIHVPGGWCSQMHGDRSSCPLDSSRLHPMCEGLAVHLYPLSYNLLCNKLVNLSVSLNSVSHSSKVSKPRRVRDTEALICN